MKKLVNILTNIICWFFDTNIGFTIFILVIVAINIIGWDIYWDNIYNN